MESTCDRTAFRRTKNDPEDFMEIEDSSLVYKLRRSCERIEELMRDVETLRRQNDFKSKIILNLQCKERELTMTIQSLRDALESQSIEFKGYHHRILITEMEASKKDDLESQYEKLKNRYANCEEENILLRNDIRERERDIYLMKEALKIRNSQFRQKEEEVKQLQKEKEELLRQLSYYDQMKLEFDMVRGNSLQKDAQIELELAKYRHILSDYEAQLHDAVRHEEGWQYNYADLSDTVHHVESLREAHRIRRVFK